MRQKAWAVLLAGALGLAALPAALAASPPPPGPTSTQVIEAAKPTPTPLPTPRVTAKTAADGGDDSRTETVFEATIVPTLISAVIPCQVAFNIDPNAEIELDFADGSKSQVSAVINADTAVVVNRSVVPIEITVTAVSEERLELHDDANHYHDLTMPDTFRLVGRLDDVQKAGTGLLVLGWGSADGWETFADEAAFEARALIPPGNETGALDDPLPVMMVAAEESKPIWVFGKIATDRYYGQYSFSVSTTFHIAPVHGAANNGATP